MLARPQDGEGRADGRFVASTGGIAKARHQAAGALDVADVRWGHRATVHERIAQSDVPRLQRMELTIEMAAAMPQLAVAVGHAPQGRERVAASAHPSGA